jgi:hypothetical protein
MVAAFALAVTQSATAAATGTFNGHAGVDLAHLLSLNVPGTFQLEDIGIAPTSAAASSSGLPGGANAHAHATNVHASVLNGAISTEQLAVADNKAPGAGTGPDVHTVLAGKIDPLLRASVATVSAQSTWNPNGCVAPGTAISTATSQLADAQLFPGTPIETTIDNARGGTVLSRSTVGLVDMAGQTGKGVRSTSVTQLTGITLFKGTSNQLTINVIAPPVVTAIAGGQPGTARVTYNHPVLQVLDAKGNKLGELNASSANTSLDLSPLAILSLGKLTSTISKAGTSAVGHADLLMVKLLDPPAPFNPGTLLRIAGGDVSALAPAGGVRCTGASVAGPAAGETNLGGITLSCGSANPLRELQIGPSTLQTVAGSLFTYAMSVSNRGDCTLEHVGVVGSVNGPPGSTITTTSPGADTVSGLTATWKDIGPLMPNATKVLLMTVQVPSGVAGGSQYAGKVAVTASSAAGDNFTQDAQVTGPKVRTTGTGSCSLVGSRLGAGHRQVVPGESFNVYVSLLNSGGVPCRNVAVSLPIDDNLSFVSCTNACTLDGRTIRWTIAEIGPGSSMTLAATLRTPDNAAAGTNYTHTATITANGASIDRSVTGPVVGSRSVLAPFVAAVFPGTSVLGAELPRTGAYIALMVAVALALIGAGSIMNRIRAKLDAE